MSAVAAPADRRFRRVHVKPARKRRWWHGLIWPLVRYCLLPVALGYTVAQALCAAFVLLAPRLRGGHRRGVLQD